MPVALMADPETSASELAVYAALASALDHESFAGEVRLRRLVDRSQLVERAVRNALARLEQRGYIGRTKRPGRPDWFTLMPTPRVAVAAEAEADTVAADPRTTGAIGGRKAKGPAPEDTTLGQGSGTKGHHSSELSPELSPELIAPARRRDLLFEAVMEVCGIDCGEISAAARGAYNRAVADLRELGASPEEVRRRAGNAWFKVTPTAIARRWAELDSPPADRGGASRILDRARRAAAEGR